MNDSTLFQGTVVFLIGNVDSKVSEIRNYRVSLLSYQCKVQSLLNPNRKRILCNIPDDDHVILLFCRFRTSSKMEKHHFQSS